MFSVVLGFSLVCDNGLDLDTEKIFLVILMKCIYVQKRKEETERKYVLLLKTL